MDTYTRFKAFIDRVIAKPDGAVVAELNRLRVHEPKQWVQLYGHLNELLDVPGVGTFGQQYRMARAKIEYLASQVGLSQRELIDRVIAPFNQHYRDHREELTSALREYTLQGASTEEIVNDFLDHLKRSPGST